MYSGAFGFPHKEVKPLPVKTHRPVTTQNIWVEKWLGKGLESDVYVQPKNWESIPQLYVSGELVREAYALIEFYVPTNLTHIHMVSDTSFVGFFGIGATHAPFYCEYSNDGVNWSRLAYPAIGNGYYKRSGCFDDLDCYFWIPRTKIKAKFWRLLVTEGYFGSSCGDSLWHISELNPGTLDNIKDDILYDSSPLTFGDDPDPYWIPLSNGLDRYDDINKGVGAGKLHKTDMQLDVMIIFRSDYGNGVTNTRLFWMDRNSIKYFSIKQDHDDNYRMGVSLLLHNGFVSNVACHGATAVWDAAHEYVSVSLASEDYLGIGWANNAAKGVVCTRAFDIEGYVIPNTLGAIPDCMWVHDNGSQVGLTHPSNPYTIYRAARDSTQAVVSMSNKSIVFDNPYMGITSGVIMFLESANFFQAGQYTGNGSSSTDIATPNISPKIVVIKNISYNEYMIISSLVPYSEVTWEVSGYNDKLDQNDGIKITDTGFTLKGTTRHSNYNGNEYLWWAWA